MKKRLAVMLTAAFFTICTVGYVAATEITSEQIVKEAKAAIKEVSINDVKKMLDMEENIIVLDVTDKQEFEAGHIPGAVNISRGTYQSLKWR